MALNIKIDFENIYNSFTKDEDLRSSTFESDLIDGSKVTLVVQISSKDHPLMPNVFNLAFGPLNDSKQIDDQIKLTHVDHSKVFSTIIFEAFSFLSQNPDKYLGIDGSNNARAYMYYRCIQNNFVYLSDYFEIYGVNYYVRLLRRKEDNTYSFDPEDLVAIPKQIQHGESINHERLYNYFIFKLKAE